MADAPYFGNPAFLFYPDGGIGYKNEQTGIDVALANAGPAGPGTVTSVSVVPANGLTGSVATATTTPAITLGTSLTGILRGNGTALVAAVASDFPVLNQNTTGTAANITGIAAVPNGGTGLTSVTLGGMLVGNGSSALSVVTPGTTGYVWTSNGAGMSPSWQPATGGGGGGSGTVTSVSVATANGFAGSVANASTTPAITMTVTVSGMLKGNGTAVAAAVSGTDYAPGTSALATGIVKSTTGTGALSIAVAGTDYTAGTAALATGLLKNTTATGAHTIATAGMDYSAGTAALATGILKTTTTTGALSVAVAGDFPTLNQNTTGTASNVTGVVAVANGGTGLSSAPANGQIDIGNGTNFTRTTITAGSGITVTNGAGSITIAATGGSGGGQLVLLATLTPTAAANLDALNVFTSAYDNYLIQINGIRPATDDALRLRFAVGGTVDNTANYEPAGGVSGATSNASTIIAGAGTMLAAGAGLSSDIRIQNANGTTGAKTFQILGSQQTNATPTFNAFVNNGLYRNTGAITGIRLYWNGGANFAAVGTVYIFGIKNT